MTLDLFDLDPGERPPSGLGCARPIGRRRTVRPRLEVIFKELLTSPADGLAA